MAMAQVAPSVATRVPNSRASRRREHAPCDPIEIVHRAGDPFHRQPPRHFGEGLFEGRPTQPIRPAASMAATPPATITRHPATISTVRCAGHLVAPSVIAQDTTPSAVWATSRPVT